MKRILNLMLAATLICGSVMFTSCSKDDDDSNSSSNLSEKIIGKWLVAERGGQPALTNEKAVFAFLSPTKGYISASFDKHLKVGFWGNQLETDVTISGNKVIVTFHSDEHNTSVHEFNITDINGSEFSANQKVNVTLDGSVVIDEESAFRFTKVSADYSEKILGLWECTGLTGGETYNDANGRLEFLADGTYRYYRKDDDGQWQAVTTREFQDYFVDGTLLATRWKNVDDAELREWWEIASINGDQMVWKALRQNEDGTTFKQEMKWKKIELNVVENIMGKWIVAERDGQPMPTNKKAVYTFVSTTKAYVSTSITAHPELGELWGDKIDVNVAINGNKVTLNSHPDKNMTVMEEYIISDINASECTANLKLTLTVDGNVVSNDEMVLRLTKVADYSTDILGLWECTGLTGDETYNDANARLEFFADGTYKYWCANDFGVWMAVTTREFQDYFLDGTLLATRWKDVGDAELREWWEIVSISGDEMVWKALRQNEYRMKFEQEMTWKKVE